MEFQNFLLTHFFSENLSGLKLVLRNRVIIILQIQKTNILHYA